MIYLILMIQFNNPKILYVLFALLIPILVHLFQLRKFQKTEFTNVKFLKEISLQTRKSSQINPLTKVLTSATFIRSAFGILKKFI